MDLLPYLTLLIGSDTFVQERLGDLPAQGRAVIFAVAVRSLHVR